jgi:undecaprenyl pyrophosphate phosphatase UppP
LTECSHEGGKCHWTAQASLAGAVPLAVLGGMTALGRSRPARRSLSIIGAILGIFVILLPTTLIGVCASDFMRCSLIMKPTLIMSGLIVTALCVAVFFKSNGDEAGV